MRSQGLLLGVDGGGTHTRAVLAEVGGRVLGRAAAGPSNQATGGAVAAGEQLAGAVLAVLDGRDPGALAAACLGLAGLDRPRDLAAYRPVVAALGLPAGTLLVNDSEIAWAGATGGAPGVTVAAGTGSVAYGRDARGRGARSGGWGLPFGDEGGAGWIATEAVRRVLRGCDGRQAPSTLAEALCAAAGCAEPEDLCRLPSGMTPEAALGRLAPAVTAAALAGDPDAADIVSRAASELAELAGGIARRLGIRGPAVHGLGSVLHDPTLAFPGTPVAAALDARLRQTLGVPLLPPRSSALSGALVLAHAAATGAMPEPHSIARWEASPW